MVETKGNTYFLYAVETIYSKAANRFKYYARAAQEGAQMYIKVNNDREVLRDLLGGVVEEIYQRLLQRHSKEIDTPVYMGLLPLREDVQVQFETKMFTDKTQYLLSSVDSGIESLLVLKLIEAWAKMNKSISFPEINVDAENKLSDVKSLVLGLRTREINKNPMY